MTLQDLINSKHKSAQKEIQEKRIMGGKFIDCTNQARFRVNQENAESLPNFWDQTVVNFTQDGTKACLQTLNETFIINLNEADDKDTYLKVQDVQYLQGRRVSIFDRGNGRMLFCELTG